MVEGLCEIPYGNRLSACRHLSLEMRRQADLVEVFRIMGGFEPIPVSYVFYIFASSMSPTRGSSKTILKPRTRLNLRKKHFFSHRVVELCNALQEEVVNNSSVNILKAHITLIFNVNRGLVKSQTWRTALVQTSSES